MKQLLLLRSCRHRAAAASSLADYHRPLTPRGEIAAMQLGKIMRKNHYIPDLALCATPARTRQTLAFIWPCLENAHGKTPKLVYDFKLHDMRGDGLLERLQQLDAECDRVLLVSTAPGICDLARMLWKAQNGAPSPFIADLPPGGLAVLTCETGKWAELAAGMCSLSELII